MDIRTARILRIGGNILALIGAVLVVFGQGELAWLRYVGIFSAVLGFAGIVGSIFVRRAPDREAESDGS